MDKDRFCQPSFPLRWCRISSAPYKALFCAPVSEARPMPEAHTASRPLPQPYGNKAAPDQYPGLPVYSHPYPRSDLVSSDSH